MGYTVNLEGFEGQNIEARNSFWSGAKLIINGNPAPKGAKRGEMLLQRNDGRQVTAKWRPQGLGLDVPQLEVDGKVINLVAPLKWYQWLWSALPIVLVFVGALLGAVTGLVAFYLNGKIFRSQMNGALKYVLTGAVSLLAVAVYFIVALWVQGLLNG